MAQRVQVILEDDFDGGAADETVAFGLDGAEFEIDLSAANAEALRGALAPWVASARRTGGRSAVGRRRRGSAPAGKSDTAKVRAWAQENGHEVSGRGRIPANVRAAYEAANS